MRKILYILTLLCATQHLLFGMSSSLINNKNSYVTLHDALYSDEQEEDKDVTDSERYDHVRMLIGDINVDINAQNEQGQTALHIAAKNNLYAIVKLLLKHGAHTNIKNAQGDIPLVTAYVHAKNERKCCEHLLNYELENKATSTALHDLATVNKSHQEEKIQILMGLLARGAHISQMNELGYTPLHCFAQENNLSSIKITVGHTNNMSDYTHIIEQLIQQSYALFVPTKEDAYTAMRKGFFNKPLDQDDQAIILINELVDGNPSNSKFLVDAKEPTVKFLLKVAKPFFKEALKDNTYVIWQAMHMITDAHKDWQVMHTLMQLREEGTKEVIRIEQPK